MREEAQGSAISGSDWWTGFTFALQAKEEFDVKTESARTKKTELMGKKKKTVRKMVGGSASGAGALRGLSESIFSGRVGKPTQRATREKKKGERGRNRNAHPERPASGTLGGSNNLWDSSDICENQIKLCHKDVRKLGIWTTQPYSHFSERRKSTGSSF